MCRHKLTHHIVLMFHTKPAAQIGSFFMSISAQVPHPSRRSLSIEPIVDAGIFGIALVIRAAIFLSGRSAFSVDADDYVEGAFDLGTKGYIADPDLMPGYPVLNLLFGEATAYLDLALSSAAAAFAAILARSIFESRSAAIAAGLGVSLHLNLAIYAGSGLTEPSTTFLFLAAMIAFFNRSFAIGSILMVLSLLIRPSFVLAAPILIAAFSIITHKDSFRMCVARLALFAAVFVVLFAPWWWHNYQVHGRFVPLNLAGSYTLYLGNNPSSVTGSGLGQIDIKADHPFADVRPLSEQRRQMGEAAVAWIFENPGRFAELTVIRLARFWHIESHSNATVWLAIQPYHAAFLLFMIFGFWRFARQSLPFVLAIGYLCAVHSVLVSLPRYQFQVTPLIIMLGLGWLAWEAERFWRARKSTPD